MDRIPAGMAPVLVALLAAQAGAGAEAAETPRPQPSYLEWPVLPVPEPDLADVRYGPERRQTMDIWLPPAAEGPETGDRASGEEGAPVLVFFHHGAFTFGDKSMLPGSFLEYARERGWAVVSANYRFTTQAPFPAPMLDGALAVQWVRAHAERLGIDPERVAVSGVSAGAGISMWLAFHPDLADPDAEDPVLRESTRVSAALALEGQGTYDPREYERMFGRDLTVVRSFRTFYPIPPERYDTPEAHEMFAQASPLTHASPEDPPVLIAHALSLTPLGRMDEIVRIIHAPELGEQVADRLEEVGVEYALDVLGRPRRASAGVNGDHLFDLLERAIETGRIGEAGEEGTGSRRPAGGGSGAE